MPFQDDYEACEQLGSIMHAPGDWQDAVSKDLDIALNFLKQACDGGRKTACEKIKQIEAEKAAE